MSTGEGPQDVFLDVKRSHEVEWRPSPEYPVRHFDEQQRITVTTHHHKMQKLTCWDDASGLAYLPTTLTGEPKSDGRGVQIREQMVHLYDGAHQQRLNVQKSWHLSLPQNEQPCRLPTTSWRECFPKGAPALSPAEAFSAVLLYPDEAQLIGEKESQPFIFDYLDDFLEEQPELRQFRETADHILLARCEASLGACLKYQRPQWHTMWYEWPAFAQKQAQQIWNTLNRNRTLDWLPQFRFLPAKDEMITTTASPFDWVNVWIPFASYDDHQTLQQWSWFLANHLVPGGIGCVAGPLTLGQQFQQEGFSVIHAERAEALPTFKIHQAILQNGWLHPELMVWIIQQS